MCLLIIRHYLLIAYLSRIKYIKFALNLIYCICFKSNKSKLSNIQFPSQNMIFKCSLNNYIVQVQVSSQVIHPRVIETYQVYQCQNEINMLVPIKLVSKIYIRHTKLFRSHLLVLGLDPIQTKCKSRDKRKHNHF